MVDNPKYVMTDTKKEVVINGKKHTVFQIKSAMQIGKKIKPDTLGGWISRYENLSQVGLCWVSNNAVVTDNAIVRGDAIIKDKATVCESAHIGGSAIISGTAYVGGKAYVYDQSEVKDFAVVKARAEISGKSIIGGTCALTCDMNVTNKNLFHFHSDELPDIAEIISNVHRGAIADINRANNTLSSFKVKMEDTFNMIDDLLRMIDECEIDMEVSKDRQDFVKDTQLNIVDTSNIRYDQSPKLPLCGCDNSTINERQARIAKIRADALAKREKIERKQGSKKIKKDAPKDEQ